MSDNPALGALEAYRRAHPRQADAVDEAMERGPEEDSEAVAAPMPAASGSEPATASEQLLLPNPDRQAIGKFNAGGPSTQREAAISQWPISGTQRRKVLDYIEKCGHQGATDEEIERYYGGRHQSVSARRNELMNDGWIEDSDVRRKTSSGREAIVWVVTAAGRAQYTAV